MFVFSACPRGAPFMMCLKNPCEGSSCPANPKARCRADSCGRCAAQFFDDNDNIVNCSASKYPHPSPWWSNFIMQHIVFCQCILASNGQGQQRPNWAKQKWSNGLLLNKQANSSVNNHVPNNFFVVEPCLSRHRKIVIQIIKKSNSFRQRVNQTHNQTIFRKAIILCSYVFLAETKGKDGQSKQHITDFLF